MNAHHMLWAASIIEVEPFGPPISDLQRARCYKSASKLRQNMREAARIDRDRPMRPIPPAAMKIIESVAIRHGVTVTAIRMPGRGCRVLCRARSLAIAEIAQSTTYSAPMIGRLFANRDKSTIRSALAVFNRDNGQSIRNIKLCRKAASR
jgi:hypothetical protein